MHVEVINTGTELLLGHVLLFGVKLFKTFDELAQFLGGDGIGADRVGH